MGKVEIFPGEASLQENELQKTRLSGDEDLNFRISSRMEILSILRAITMQGTRACMHYGSGLSVMTRTVGLDENGMWLDAGRFPQEHLPFLLEAGVTFVSMHQHVKIQFDAGQVLHGLFRDRNALYLKWPEYLLRIQRREFFRSLVPQSGMARCIIPVSPEDAHKESGTRATPLVDISGGGVRLLCDGNDTTLMPEKTLHDCRLALQDDTLTVTLEVRNSNPYTTSNNESYKRVGCRFVDLDNYTNILLQRHITLLQGEAMNRRRARG